jgi:hypothetical protein
MYATMWRNSLKGLLVVLVGLAASPLPALAQYSQEQWQDESAQRWWLGVGLGGATVHSLAPAPSAGRNAFAASLDFGYRFTPQWGLGLEFGTVAPVSGCADRKCTVTSAEFAPNFTRMFAFGEFRPRDSGLRFRAGAGVSRFCYRSHWSNSSWSWGDTLNLALQVLGDELIDDTIGGTGGYRCDDRKKALGGALSVGYDWPVADGAPVSMGLRLSGEAANFSATPAVGLPAFRHRAVMLTLHLNIN